MRMGGASPFSRDDAQLLLRDGHAERLVSVREVELDGVDLARQERMEPQPVAAHLESEVAARDEVDGPAIAAMCTPSRVVPCWMSSRSLRRACPRNPHERARSRRASSHECTTFESVEPYVDVAEYRSTVRTTASAGRS